MLNQYESILYIQSMLQLLYWKRIKRKCPHTSRENSVLMCSVLCVGAGVFSEGADSMGRLCEAEIWQWA